MFNLVRNEWMKIFKRPGTYVMIGLLVLIIGIVGAVLKYDMNNGPNGTDNEKWRQNVQTQLDDSKAQLKKLENGPKEQYEYFRKDVVMKEYQLEHNIAPQDPSVWEFVNEASNVVLFVGLFVIIVAAGIVSSEFNWGTIKLLLIRPISRGKFLLSKYITVLLFALLMLTISFVFSSLVGVILFGTPDSNVPYLNYYDGKVSEQNMVLHLIILYGLKSISMLMLATMAFMISAVFRNSSLAIGLSIFLLFMGGQLTALLATKFEWAKYILFANTELMQYFEGRPMVEGMTLTFSVVMLAVYFIIFQVLAYFVFKKRDVAA
jgi:ABC-2 type transport system permease protein